MGTWQLEKSGASKFQRIIKQYKKDLGDKNQTRVLIEQNLLLKFNLQTNWI